MSTNPLSPGQYRINGCKFGKGTQIPVGNVQIQSYNVQAQDDQSIMSDELNMKQDSLMPAPIVFEMSVQDFRVMPNMQALANSVSFDRESYEGLLNRLSFAWRGDNVRRNFGQITPLEYCRRDGKVMAWYGRPRKFQASKATSKSAFYAVTAEFQRADTLVYGFEENFQVIEQQADPVFITRTEGDCASWLRILGYGPLDHPVITIGDQEVYLDLEIDEDTVFEISSYPWQRRAVDSNGFNIASKLAGDTQYLDRLRIPANAATPVRWTAANVNTWVPSLESTSWTESLNGLNYRKLNGAFNQILGRTVTHIDLFNPRGPVTYIGGTWIGVTTAVLYDKKQFGTADQYAEARLVEPWSPGGSGVVIMSNSTMTNFIVIEAHTNAWDDDELRISTGTSPTALTQRASLNLGRNFNEYDKLGIGFNPTTKVYNGYLNGEMIDGLYWHDPTGIVNTANRHQGFLFDIHGNFLTRGTGFKDILAYDRATVPSPVGGIVIGWQDAYSSLEG